jgi:hypothetical protein
VPLTAHDGGRRVCPTCSRRRRAFGRGRTGPIRPPGPTVSRGGWCARGAVAEHGRWRWMAVAVMVHTRSRWGAGEQGRRGHAWASRKCRDAFPVPNLVGDGAEGGDQRWGGSGSHRQRWRRGVLSSEVLEGGGEVARELLQVGVVLLVPLVAVKRLYNSGATARLSGRRNWSSSALWSGYSSGRNLNWFARWALVSRGGAVCALDRRWGVWQNQPELYRLKHASPLQRASTYFKRYNLLVCRVASR